MKRQMKEFKAMGNDERKKKIEELKFELIKSKAGAAKTGGSKIKEIKKAIARIYTLDKEMVKESEDSKLLKRKISKVKS
ncbi:MAG: 50S ribosomal protein L29 [Nanoarchaeota archaeon]|nr:50S ribosomal protein L29 [Nanoarchaeota archaeon]MBU1501162.1 50S ribosomal protein L29 [Nanoarchaeota archaeon]MBU2458842.1 50S ribosomal protein L29 [Nanoarchaeota archaeon]